MFDWVLVTPVPGMFKLAVTKQSSISFCQLRGYENSIELTLTNLQVYEIIKIVRTMRLRLRLSKLCGSYFELLVYFSV